MPTRQVGIIGAGPAGVTAAQIIAREDMEVTLFSAEKVLPYYRQRLPELAFGDEQPENVFMNKLYKPFQLSSYQDSPNTY